MKTVDWRQWILKIKLQLIEFVEIYFFEREVDFNRTEMKSGSTDYVC